MTPRWIRRKFRKSHPKWDKNDLDCATGLTCMIVYAFIIIRTGMGYEGANNTRECRVESIGDIVMAPFYALGCNLGKKRFKQSLILGGE